MNESNFIKRTVYEVYRYVPGTGEKVRIALFENYPQAMDYIKEFEDFERKRLGVIQVVRNFINS